VVGPRTTTTRSGTCATEPRAPTLFRCLSFATEPGRMCRRFTLGRSSISRTRAGTSLGRATGSAQRSTAPATTAPLRWIPPIRRGSSPRASTPQKRGTSLLRSLAALRGRFWFRRRSSIRRAFTPSRCDTPISATAFWVTVGTAANIPTGAYLLSQDHGCFVGTGQIHVTLAAVGTSL
jgi:hypothetical protein